MSTSKVVGAVVALIGLVAACGPKEAETPASPKLVQVCDAICGKRAACDAKADAAACRTRCTTYESMRHAEAFRESAGDSFLACIVTNACDADLAAAANRCAVEVSARLPPSAKAKALCAKLEPQFRDCNVTWRVPCVAELNLFADQDLAAFDECVDRQCRNGATCFRSAEAQVVSKHH
jgi:hypothetical protein